MPSCTCIIIKPSTCGARSYYRRGSLVSSLALAAAAAAAAAIVTRPAVAVLASSTELTRYGKITCRVPSSIYVAYYVAFSEIIAVYEIYILVKTIAFILQFACLG